MSSIFIESGNRFEMEDLETEETMFASSKEEYEDNYLSEEDEDDNYFFGENEY